MIETTTLVTLLVITLVLRLLDAILAFEDSLDTYLKSLLQRSIELVFLEKEMRAKIVPPGMPKFVNIDFESKMK